MSARLGFRARIVVALVLGGCTPTPGPIPPPAPDASDSGGPAPTPPADAAPAPVDACAAAEAKLLALACKDSRGRLLGGPTLHGETWSALCRENAAHGVDMQPGCIASKTTCAEVSTCR